MKMARTVSNDFCMADIKAKIKGKEHTEEYLRGYITACYVLGVIEKEESAELKQLLKRIEEEKTNE